MKDEKTKVFCFTSHSSILLLQLLLLLVSISSTFYVQLLQLVDPKSVKKIDNLAVFFTLLGSASVKAVPRTLMKLSPGHQFSGANLL